VDDERQRNQLAKVLDESNPSTPTFVSYRLSYPTTNVTRLYSLRPFGYPGLIKNCLEGSAHVCGTLVLPLIDLLRSVMLPSLGNAAC